MLILDFAGAVGVPFDAKHRDPAPLVAALADRDWATRWAAVKALERLPPPLEPAGDSWQDWCAMPNR